MTTNKELRELAKKATPGAWGKDGVYVCTTITAGETIYVQTWNAVAESHEESNAQFIAAANPATILALLDENEALQAECEKLRKAIRRLCNIYVVDDYYSGDLREERLNQAVTAAMEKESTP